MHGEKLVVSVGLHEITRGSQQLEANEQREKASDKEKESDGDEVEKRDAFMVRGKQPGPGAVVLVQIILALSLRIIRRSHHSVPLTSFVAPVATSALLLAGADELALLLASPLAG